MMKSARNSKSQAANALEEANPMADKQHSNEHDDYRTLELVPAARILPQQLLADYHRLLDKKFAQGLSREDQEALTAVEAALDAAEMASPAIAAADAEDQARYEQMTAALENILQQLETLSHEHRNSLRRESLYLDG